MLGAVFLVTHVSLYFAPLMFGLAPVALSGRLKSFPVLPLAVAGWLVLIYVAESLNTHQHGADLTLILAAGAGLAAALVGLLFGYRLPAFVPALVTISAATVLLANTAFWYLGFEPPWVMSIWAVASMLDTIGISAYRAQFYFAYGINAYGTLAGFMMVLFAAHAKALYAFSGRVSFFAIAMAVLALAHVLMTDSRGALGVGLACIAFMFTGRESALYRWGLALSLAAAPFLIVAGEAINHALADYARIGTDVSTGRIPYWERIFDVLSDDWYLWPVGVGLAGADVLWRQIGSVDGLHVALQLQGQLPGAHNIWLQALVEGGLFKVAFIITIFALTALRLPHMNPGTRTLAFATIYIPLVGIF